MNLNFKNNENQTAAGMQTSSANSHTGPAAHLEPHFIYNDRDRRKNNGQNGVSVAVNSMPTEKRHARQASGGAFTQISIEDLE